MFTVQMNTVFRSNFPNEIVLYTKVGSKLLRGFDPTSQKKFMGLVLNKKTKKAWGGNKTIMDSLKGLMKKTKLRRLTQSAFNKNAYILGPAFTVKMPSGEGKKLENGITNRVARQPYVDMSKAAPWNKRKAKFSGTGQAFMNTGETLMSMSGEIVPVKEKLKMIKSKEFKVK